MTEQEQWMTVALEEAKQAALEGEVPVGAVLVRGDSLICREHNRREQLHDPTAHAEMLCIREGAKQLGNWRLSDCTLYVTLEPCPMCAGTLLMSRVKHCVFGASDPGMGCCGSVYDIPADPAFNGKGTWQSGILEQACTQLLQDFFSHKR